MIHFHLVPMIPDTVVMRHVVAFGKMSIFIISFWCWSIMYINHFKHPRRNLSTYFHEFYYWYWTWSKVRFTTIPSYCDAEQFSTLILEVTYVYNDLCLVQCMISTNCSLLVSNGRCAVRTWNVLDFLTVFWAISLVQIDLCQSWWHLLCCQKLCESHMTIGSMIPVVVYPLVADR